MMQYITLTIATQFHYGLFTMKQFEYLANTSENFQFQNGSLTSLYGYIEG